jgi:hypothetical protein
MNEHRLVPTAALLIAFAALLAFAGTASAETKVGEYTGALIPGIPAEANVLGATGEYDSTAGTLNFTVTTAAAPQATLGTEPNEIQLDVGFATLPVCSFSALQSGAGYPVFELEARYAQPVALAITAESQAELLSGNPALLSAGTRTVEGTKTTLTAQSAKAVGKPYNCGIVSVQNIENAEGKSVQEINLFPLSLKPTPPPAVTPPAPVQAQPAPPTPPAAALSIAKAKKPLKVKVGKWATVKVKVTDSGGTATGPGSLRVKAPAGVLVKPERQKLPVLQAGESWTLSVRVQLTRKAKKSSTLSLVGAAGTASAKGSLVLKVAGG